MAGSLRLEQYVDGNDDELHIGIVLRDKYRADFARAGVGRFGASPGLGERVGGGDAASLTRSYFWKSYLTAPRSDANSANGGEVPTQHEGGADCLVPSNLHQSGRSTIAWPAYLKDLNWYLFQFPERPVNHEPGDDWSARTQGTAGSPNWPSPATWRGDKYLWDDVEHSAYGSADGQG